MGVALTWCAAAIALVPTILGVDALAAVDGRSRFTFALVPWLLLAGLPLRRPLNVSFALGLALPTLALSAWLDMRAEIEATVLLQRATWALASACLVQLAARRARGGNLYGFAWFFSWLAIPSFGALVAAFQGGNGGTLSEVATACGAGSRALSVAVDPRIVPLDALALASAAALFGLALLDRRVEPLGHLGR